MTEPKNLQNRVAVAFNASHPGAPDDQDIDSFETVDYFHSLEPDADDDVIDDPQAARLSTLRYWLAGAGLISSALILSMGTTSGFVLLALCLGAIGIASLLFSFAAKLENQQDAKSAKNVAGLDATASRDDNAFVGSDMLASIHDALGDMTLCRNLSGVILSANNTFRVATGAAKPEGRTCEELGIQFKPGDIKHSYDVVIIKAGKSRTFLWHDVVARDPMLGDLVIQSIARDVTEERMNAAAREAARVLAEEESGLKSRLIATVSHEIRTPLSGLLGMGQLLAGTKLTAEQQNYLEGIRQSGTALAQLVEDLLDFSTLAAGRFQLRPRDETIRPLVEGVVEMLASKAHAKGVEIGASIAPNIPEILNFDPARFRQVLFNVIGNAVKFTETGGVLVMVGMDGGMLEVKVKDSGPGMNDAELKRIFGEFEQGDLSRIREGGVGLGLAISAKIMSEAGGALDVESELGLGSTFTIRLPVTSNGPAMRGGVELSSAKVLLLAPEGPAATAVACSLDRLGADVHRASDIETALFELDQEYFNGVIVDHRLDMMFVEHLAGDPRLAAARKIYLVNPESRPASMSGDIYDSWLIRPLREQSLIDVLNGKLKGLEPRMAANDDFPVLAAEHVEEVDTPTPTPVEVLKSGLSILLGEDDPVNAMIAQAILEKAGHRVRLADNFARLGSMHTENPANLILTDFSMADGTSEGFIEKLREDEEAHSKGAMPVIVLTADTSDETRRMLLRKGADLVLTKPAGPDILIGAIARLTGRDAA